MSTHEDLIAAAVAAAPDLTAEQIMRLRGPLSPVVVAASAKPHRGDTPQPARKAA